MLALQLVTDEGVRRPNCKWLKGKGQTWIRFWLEWFCFSP